MANPNEPVAAWLDDLCRRLDATPDDPRARLLLLSEAAERADQEIPLVPWRRFLRSEAHLIARGGSLSLLQLAATRTERSPLTQAFEAHLKAGRLSRPWMRRRGRPREDRPNPCWRTFELGRGALLGLEVLPGAQQALVLFEDKTVHQVDLERGLTLRTVSLDATCLLLCDTERELLFLGGGDSQIDVFDVALQWRRTIPLLAFGRVVSLAAGGGVAAALSSDGGVLAARLSDGSPLAPPRGVAPAATLAVLPKSSRFLVGGADGQLRIWEAETGIVKTLRGHAARITALCASPDGRHALTGSDDQTLRYWDLDSGKALQTLGASGGAITGLTTARNGRFALSASTDRLLRYWDLESGQCLKMFPGHAAPAHTLHLFNDGRRALSGADDQTVRLWDLDATTPLGIGESGAAPVCSVSFFPGGRRALSLSTDATLKLWDTEAGACLQTIRTNLGPQRFALPLADGRFALLAGDDGLLRLFSLDADKVTRTTKAHGGQVGGLLLTLEGRRLVSAGADGIIRLWELEAMRPARAFTGHAGPIKHIELYPDGRRIVSLSQDGTLRMWDLDTGSCIGTHRGSHFAEATTFALHPEGSEIALGAPGWLALYDLGTGRRLQILSDRPGCAEHLLYTGQGAQLAAAGLGRSLELYPTEGGPWLARWDSDPPITALAASPRGRFAIGDALGGVGFFDLALDARQEER